MRMQKMSCSVVVAACFCACLFGSGYALAAGVKAWELGAKAAADPANRTGWKALEEGATATGAVALENGSVVLVAQPGAAGPVLFAKGAGSRLTRADLAFIGKDGRAGAIDAVKLASVGFAKGAVTVTSGDFQIELQVQAGQPLVIVKASRAGGFLEIASSSRYAIRPGFDGDGILDAVYDPTRLTNDTVSVVAENFLVNCLEGNRAVMMCVWPTKSLDKKDQAAVKLLVQGKDAARRIAATRIEFLESPIHVSILEHERIWFDEDVSSFVPGTAVKVDWKRPFEALWRMNVLPPKDSTAKSRTFTFVNDPKSTIPATFRGKDTHVMMPGEGANPYSRMVVYPVDRITTTPMTVYTPVDIMRHSLGVGPCEYVLDFESREEEPAPVEEGEPGGAAGAGPTMLEGVPVPPDTPEQAALRTELQGQGYIYLPVGNQLFRLNADGSDKQLIWEIAGKRTYISYTQVSWDGKWVAVVVMSSKTKKDDQRVWLLRHDGSDAKEVLQDKKSGVRISCAWSPDNAWLVISHGTTIDGLNLETREIKRVFEAEGGEVSGMTHLSSDRNGSYYFWNRKIKGKGDTFTLDKDCNVVKPLSSCGMWTACQPSVSPDGSMIARHHHDYETNDGAKRGYVSSRPVGGGKRTWRYIPETKNFGYHGTHNMPFWSDDSAYIGYTYLPNAMLLEKDGYAVPKNSGVLVVCRTRVGGGPMLWLTISTNRGASCSWGPVPE